MRAARIHRFGPPSVIVIEDVSRPVPGDGEILVHVAAAGVGPWDALIREGKSKVSPPPPLTLGSDLSGVVEAVGPGVTGFNSGDEVYGVTNPQFIGANAEYALASSGMVARKPARLSHVEAASVPVVAVTAWQMFSTTHTFRPAQRHLSSGQPEMSEPTPCNWRFVANTCHRYRWIEGSRLRAKPGSRNRHRLPV